MKKKIIKIKVSTSFPSYPLIRQTPNSQGIWGNCQFYINEDIEKCDWWVVYENIIETEKVNCPKNNTILITGEPSTIKKYNPGFLKQFKYVITSQKEIKHENKIILQQSLPWWVGIKYNKSKRRWDNEGYLNFDDFKKLQPTKEKIISVITSNKNQTLGHRKRLEFVNKLKEYFGDSLDVYGRGINDFEDKLDTTAPYKYQIVLENCFINDYWTEKLADCFLSQTYPIYYGCPNIYNYFSEKSITKIDIDNPDEAIKIINKTLSRKTYEKNMQELLDARNLVLDKYNFFPFICNFIKQKNGTTANTKVILNPEVKNNKNLKNILGHILCYK